MLTPSRAFTLFILTVVFVASCTLAFASPGWDGVGGSPGPPPPPTRKAMKDECIWSFVDAVGVRSDMMPAYKGVTLETRTRLCYHEFAYSIVTYQRYVNGDGKPITEWKALPEGYLWLTIKETDQSPVREGPGWGDRVFKHDESLPE